MLKFVCVTKVNVFEEYEILSFQKAEAIQPHWFERFELDSTRIFEKVMDTARSKNIADSIILPTEKALVKAKRKMKSYNPLTEAADLYTHFAGINPNKNSSLLKFVCNYGIPASMIYERTYDVNDQAMYQSIMNLLAFSSDLKIQLKAFKETYSLWDSIKSHDLPYLKKVISKYPEDFFVNHASTLDKAQSVLADYIQGSLRWGHTLAVVEGKIRPILFFDHLYRIMDFQLYQAVVYDVPVKHCEFESCNKIFEDKNGRKFCPPFPGNKRSTCENTANQRLKRMKKKLANETF
jgi:hypothetical protein